MDTLIVVAGILAVALLVLAIGQLIRLGLRLWRDELEMEPGGSFGRQLRRDRKPRP